MDINAGTIIAGVFLAIFLVAGISLFLAFPVMWCWNYAVVSTFALPAITWGKAWCLTFLSSMFFKSTLNTHKHD